MGKDSCLYWARGDVECPDGASGLAGRLGSASHLRGEEWYYGRPASALADDVAADALRISAQLIKWLEPRRSRIIMCEIGMRYDAEHDTATTGPRRGEPGYGDVGPMILPGTLDYALRGEDGVLEVVDVKTGAKANTHPEQLRAQALSVARHLGEDCARAGFVFPRKTKCDEPEWEALDADRLDREAGRIHRTLKLLPTAQANSGDWCFKCGLRGACPATKEGEA